MYVGEDDGSTVGHTLGYADGAGVDMPGKYVGSVVGLCVGDALGAPDG